MGVHVPKRAGFLLQILASRYHIDPGARFHALLCPLSIRVPASWERIHFVGEVRTLFQCRFQNLPHEREYTLLGKSGLFLNADFKTCLMRENTLCWGSQDSFWLQISKPASWERIHFVGEVRTLFKRRFQNLPHEREYTLLGKSGLFLNADFKLQPNKTRPDACVRYFTGSRVGVII
jgi:hypothetical protein